MMRLIDAEEVVKAIDRHTFDTDDGLCLDEDITIILEEVPTAQPKKGKWLPDNNDYEHLYYYCSNCRRETQIPRYVGGFLYDFCPNCGADMRGDENGTD